MSMDSSLLVTSSIYFSLQSPRGGNRFLAAVVAVTWPSPPSFLRERIMRACTAAAEFSVHKNLPLLTTSCFLLLNQPNLFYTLQASHRYIFMSEQNQTSNDERPAILRQLVSHNLNYKAVIQEGYGKKILKFQSTNGQKGKMSPPNRSLIWNCHRTCGNALEDLSLLTALTKPRNLLISICICWPEKQQTKAFLRIQLFG